MRNALTQNLGTLILALVLAVAVWAIANAEQNPEVTATFASTIPVEVVNLPQGIVVYGSSPGAITLKLRAPQDSWSRLRASSFRASVDLRGSTPGLHEFEPSVACLDPRVRILEKDPSRVPLRLEAIRQRSVPVRVRALDEAPVGYTMLSLQITPSQVTITGPAPLAEPVSEAYVEVRVEGSKVTFAKTYQPVLRDAQGREVKGVEVSPSSVTVEIPIERLKNYKTLSVKAVITGTVAAGYWISGIVVQPSAVTLGGEPQVLESFGYMETSPVNVSGAITEVLRSVSILVPPGTALEKKEEVFVKVSVEPIPGGGVIRRPVTVRNPTMGITATVMVPGVDVRLDGPVPILHALKPTDIVVSVVVSGLLTGTYELPLTVTGVPTSTWVVAITPDRVGVSIR